MEVCGGSWGLCVLFLGFIVVIMVAASYCSPALLAVQFGGCVWTGAAAAISAAHSDVVISLALLNSSAPFLSFQIVVYPVCGNPGRSR